MQRVLRSARVRWLLTAALGLCLSLAVVAVAVQRHRRSASLRCFPRKLPGYEGEGGDYDDYGNGSGDYNGEYDDAGQDDTAVLPAEGASRGGGGTVAKWAWPWLATFWVPEEEGCTKLVEDKINDGLLTGMGVRITDKCIIAHKHVLYGRIHGRLGMVNEPVIEPHMVAWHPPATLDIYQPRPRARPDEVNYKVTKVLDLGYDFNVYHLTPLTDANHTQPQVGFPLEQEEWPGVELESNVDVNCTIFTYTRPDPAVSHSERKLAKWALVRGECRREERGRVCDFWFKEQARCTNPVFRWMHFCNDYFHIAGSTEGRVCGEWSDAGAPIVCSYLGPPKVTYILLKPDQSDKTFKDKNGCRGMPLKALHLGDYTEKGFIGLGDFAKICPKREKPWNADMP